MPDAPNPRDLDELEARINAAKSAKETGQKHESHSSGAGVAWTMVLELVVGMAIGFGIGYGLDSLFGTLPIFLILFILLGFAAGVRTMMQTAKDLQDKNAQDAKAKRAKD